MILPIDADRVLVRVVTAARSRPPVEAVAPGDRAVGADEGGEKDTPVSGARRTDLERLVRIAVVGEPDELVEALTADASGRTPALRFESRAQAEALLRDHPSLLRVTEFVVVRLSWAAPQVTAEWQLRAVHAEPFLVADDWLVDVHDDPVALAGITVAIVRGDRIAAINTSYDEAALIEQVVLRVGRRWSPAAATRPSAPGSPGGD